MLCCGVERQAGNQGRVFVERLGLNQICKRFEQLWAVRDVYAPAGHGDIRLSKCLQVEACDDAKVVAAAA
jgi:hypothetical protein